MRAMLVLLGALAALMGALAGCGAQEPDVRAPTPTEARRALAGSPPQLAALHREASRLLGGGQAAFERRLAGLRGRPVVVNAWASWCGPCTLEMPLLQRAAVGYGRRVGFVGVNVEDVHDDATSFARDHWMAYPSYVDQDRDIAHSIGVRVGLPTTVFYDRSGRVAFVHQGPYRDEAQLVADLRRYALAS
jgi:cytochrome c biogenesis protein CcmG, thiol:disulfide interchange protein DsbE